MVRQNNKSKGKGGRKQDEVWECFEKKALKSAGHFSAECKFCHKKWNRAYVGVLQSHLANECPECPEVIQNYWLGYLAAKDSLNDDDDVTSITSQESTNSKNKKRKGLNGKYIKYQLLLFFLLPFFFFKKKNCSCSFFIKVKVKLKIIMKIEKYQEVKQQQLIGLLLEHLFVVVFPFL